MNYIKMAGRALKALHQSVPALRMGHDLLFLPPAGHVLRCFALETSFEIKGTAYFWRTVMPLYRPPTFLILNYADRLLGGERVSVLEPDLSQTVDRLVQVISQGELDGLKLIQSPQDFLQKIDWSHLPRSPNYRLDLALTYYMSGNVSACRKVLEQVVSARFSPRWADSVRLAQDLLEELKVDTSALARRIEAWEASNIRWFHLESRTRDADRSTGRRAR
jgi:hypothetical protein